jgi:predicted GNAT superfamily acetyltransferase
MFEWNVQNRLFHIRDVEGEIEHHAIEDIQKEAWGFNDLDIVPAATLIATQHAGGIVLGAFEGHSLIGFAYAFPAFEEGRTSMHSHMLAVRPEYRNCHAGFYLKLVQRERVLEKRLDEVTWTFDPLQSLNAHLNFSKLGVVSRRYLVNFYGEASSSPLHQGFGTDRLWVSWLLNSARVKQCVSRTPLDRSARAVAASNDTGVSVEAALIYCEDTRPIMGDFGRVLEGNRCAIEIPQNINSIKERDPGLGTEWRTATRAAFLAAIEHGFLVEDFVKIDSDRGPRWFYSLSK